MERSKDVVCKRPQIFSHWYSFFFVFHGPPASPAEWQLSRSWYIYLVKRCWPLAVKTRKSKSRQLGLLYVATLASLNFSRIEHLHSGVHTSFAAGRSLCYCNKTAAYINIGCSWLLDCFSRIDAFLVKMTQTYATAGWCTKQASKQVPPPRC